jgi:hypothetical protein
VRKQTNCTIAIPRCALTWFHVESITRVSRRAPFQVLKRRRHCKCVVFSRHQPCWNVSGNIHARSVWWPFKHAASISAVQKKKLWFQKMEMCVMQPRLSPESTSIHLILKHVKNKGNEKAISSHGANFQVVIKHGASNSAVQKKNCGHVSEFYVLVLFLKLGISSTFRKTRKISCRT